MAKLSLVNLIKSSSRTYEKWKAIVDGRGSDRREFEGEIEKEFSKLSLLKWRVFRVSDVVMLSTTLFEGCHPMEIICRFADTASNFKPNSLQSLKSSEDLDS